MHPFAGAFFVSAVERDRYYRRPSHADYKNSSVMNTTTQARTETLKRLWPNHASKIAMMNARVAAMGFWVAFMIAGNVMTDSVTYGT